MPPPLKISVLRPAAFIFSQRARVLFDVLERALLARREAVDVLRAAVVRQQAAQLQVRQLVDELRERDRVLARRDAAARADGDVDHDVGDDAGFFRGRRQVARVLLVVHGLDEVRVASSNCIARRILRGDGLLVVIRSASMPGGEQRLGFAQLGGADADRAGGHLQLRNRRALVRLGVRPRRDAVARAAPPASSRCCAPACRGRRRAPACRDPTSRCRRSTRSPSAMPRTSAARVALDRARESTPMLLRLRWW